MKRSLKGILSALTALVLPALGWAANPKPVYLLDCGTVTAVHMGTDTWFGHTQQGGGQVNPASDDANAVQLYMDTSVGGNWDGSNTGWTAAPITFSEGEYVGLDGTEYDSVLAEMAATLGLNVDTIDTSVYQDGVCNRGVNGHTAQITGLTSGKTYVLYYIAGGMRNDRVNAGFTLTSYSGSPKVSYVVTAAGRNTSVATSYTDVSPLTTNIRAGATGGMLVRVAYVKPDSDGKIKFKIETEGVSAINCIAVAEIPPIERTLESAEETWSTTSEWTDGVVPSETSAVELTVTSSTGSTLTLDAPAAVDQLTIAGDYALTFAGNQTLTATSTAVDTNVDVSQMTAEANLGAVTIASGKTLTVGDNATLTSMSGAGTVVLDDPENDALKSFPYRNKAGNYQLNRPLTQGELVIGSTSTTSITQTITVNDTMTLGSDSATGRVFATTAGTQCDTTINQNADIIINSTQDAKTNESASVIIGHWHGKSTYNLNSGTLDVSKGTLLIAYDAQVTFNIGDGIGEVGSAKVIAKSAHCHAKSNTSAVVINADGRFEIGADGLTCGTVDNSRTLSLNGGTLAFTDAGECTLAMTHGITLAANSTIEVAGTVTSTSAFSATNEAALTKTGAGTLNLSGASLPNTLSYAVEGGTLILPAGAEGTKDGDTITQKVTITNGTLKIQLTEQQVTMGYTANMTEGDVTFLDASGNEIDAEYVDGYTYTSPIPTWTPTAGNQEWDDTTLWTHITDGVPTSGAVVINTSELTTGVEVAIPEGFTSVVVNGNTTAATTITAFAPTAAATVTITGMVKLPIAVINNDNVTLAYGDNATLIADIEDNPEVDDDATLTKDIVGNFTFRKEGAGTLMLQANISPDKGSVIGAGTVKFENNNGDGSQNTEREPHAFGAGKWIGQASVEAQYTGTTGDVRVKSGATLDINGHVGSWLRYVTLEAGATYANLSEDGVGNAKRQCAGIILEGDATVNAVAELGLVASDYAATKIELNGHTLTKIGAGNFILPKTTVSGGTLSVTEGTGKFVAYDNATTFADITFDTALTAEAFDLGTSSLSGTVTKKGTGSLTLGGVISGSGALTVEAGTLVLTAANTRTGNVVIENGGTLDLSATNASVFTNSGYYNSGTYVTIRGTLKVKSWDYGANLGNISHYAARVSIDGGTVIFTETLSSARMFTVTNNGATFDVGDKNITFLANDNSNLEGAGGLVTKKGSGILTINDVCFSGYSFAVEEGELSFTVAQTCTGEISVAEGASISSTASLANALKFEAGSILNASAGALTVTGSVTLPTEGTVTAKVASDAGVGTEILTCATEGLDLTKITIDGVDGMVAAANTEGTAIVLATAAVVAGPYGADTYASLQDAIDYYVENHGNGNWPSPDFTFTVLAPITEEVKLPSGYSFTLTNLNAFDITGLTVKDEDGNVIDLVDGKYSNIPYVATVTIGEESTKCADMDAVFAAIAADGVTEAAVTLHSSTPIELESTWVITKTITLDLAEVTLNAAFTYTADNPAAIWVKDGGVLTIKNGTLSSSAEGIRLGVKGATDDTQAGTVVIESDASIVTTDIAIMIYGGSTLTSNGTISASGTNATAIQGNGLETVPTTITIPSGMIMSANDLAIYHPQPGTLTIGGDEDGQAPTINGMTGIEMRAGTINVKNGWISANAGSYSAEANGNGSTVTGAALAVSQHTTGYDVAVNVTGGLFAANGHGLAVVNLTGKDPVAVTGSIVGSALTYSTALVDIPTVALEGDATNGYTLKTVVAAIGEEKYETLADAYKAATAEANTITVLADITEGGLKITKPVTIDFGGYTYTIVSPGVGSGDKTSNGIQIVRSAGAVTLKNGTIQIAAEDAADFYILIQNYANLTLIDMTLDGTYLDKWIAQYGDSYTLSVNSGTVSLEGKTTIKANNDGEKSYAFDSHDYAEMGYDAPTVVVGEKVKVEGKVEVSGGKLDNDSTTALDVVITGGGTVEGEATVDTNNSTYLVEVNGVYCSKAVDADGNDATDAATVFTGIATEAADGVATVAWQFGISDITRNGDTVTITAKVTQADATTAAGYAEGTTVTIYADGTSLGGATVAADGTATLTGVKAAGISGKKLTVKATK